MNVRHRAALALSSALVVVAAVVLPANADTITAYLGWTVPAGPNTPCTGPALYRTGAASFDPAAHSRTWLYSDVVVGATRTKVFRQDGVSRADIYYGCQNSVLINRYTPTSYQHRKITQTWLCYSGSCRFSSELKSPWTAGTW